MKLSKSDRELKILILGCGPNIQIFVFKYTVKICLYLILSTFLNVYFTCFCDTVFFRDVDFFSMTPSLLLHFPLQKKMCGKQLRKRNICRLLSSLECCVYFLKCIDVKEKLCWCDVYICAFCLQ